MIMLIIYDFVTFNTGSLDFLLVYAFVIFGNNIRPHKYPELKGYYPEITLFCILIILYDLMDSAATQSGIIKTIPEKDVKLLINITLMIINSKLNAKPQILIKKIHTRSGTFS